MGHFYLFLYITSFIMGAFASALLYVRNLHVHDVLSKCIQCALLVLTVIISCNGLDFYLNNILHTIIWQVRFILLNIVLISVILILVVTGIGFSRIIDMGKVRNVKYVFAMFSFVFYIAIIWIVTTSSSSMVNNTIDKGFSLTGIFYSTSAIIMIAYVMTKLDTISVEYISTTRLVVLVLIVLAGLLLLIELNVIIVFIKLPIIRMSPIFLIIGSLFVIKYISFGKNDVLSDITVPIGKLPKKENLDKMQLSEREREIVSLLFQGMDVNEISSKLYISSNTVRNHLYNIYKKNGIRNRMQLMKKLM